MSRWDNHHVDVAILPHVDVSLECQVGLCFLCHSFKPLALMS